MIVDVPMVKKHLRVDYSDDDALIEAKIKAAQAHLEGLLGFKINDEYPPIGTPPKSTAPDDLVECVCLLAAHWYENREGSLVGVNAQELPLGISDIVREHRNWSW